MRVLVIFPGPKYNLEETYKARLQAASKFFEGTVITSGPKSTTVFFDRFSVIRCKDPYGKSFISTIKIFFIGFQVLLKSLITREKYDIVVTYDPLKAGLIGLTLSKLFRTRLVVEVNGDYQNDALYKNPKGGKVRSTRKKIFSLIMAFVLKRSDGIKLLYPEQLSSLNIDLSRKVVRSFEDFTNTELFERKPESNTLLLVGFPFFVKGVDVFISAFKLVSEKYPEWTAKIIGYYPDPTPVTEAIGCFDRIQLVPPMYQKELNSHIGSCGIFVLPSRTEAMGRVLIEAMSCAKPRVASRVGGIPTVIDDHVDGLLVDPGSIEELAQALDLLMGNQSLRQELGENAFSRWKREFTIAAFTDRTANFYQSVLSLSGPESRRFWKRT